MPQEAPAALGPQVEGQVVARLRHRVESPAERPGTATPAPGEGARSGPIPSGEVRRIVRFCLGCQTIIENHRPREQGRCLPEKEEELPAGKSLFRVGNEWGSRK